MRKEVIGFAMCGSFCTFQRALDSLEQLHQEFETVIPILSFASCQTDTRFGTARAFSDRMEQICGRPPLCTLAQVEPFGPKKQLDLLVIAPCTGNTLGKLAHGIADTPVTLAAKAHLRNGRPIVLGISTNDGLSGNAQSIGQLLNRRHYYFVPFGQDAPMQKPDSLVADFSQLTASVCAALEGRQLQPILL